MLDERLGGIAISATGFKVPESYKVTTSARFPREIGFRGINELAVAREQHVRETVARAQRSQISARVAVDQVRHSVGHVGEHEIVHPHPVFRGGYGQRRHLRATLAVRREFRTSG